MLRVLAFEDSFDIERLLESGGVQMARIEIDQAWDSEAAIDRIREFAPDILLLDHFMPPKKGLEVLQELNLAVAEGLLERPDMIVAMSSASMPNQRMLQFGADLAILKLELASLDIWPRPSVL